MELNISHTSSFQFENKENLRNTAKEILNKNGSSKEATEKIIEETIFDNNKNYVGSNKVARFFFPELEELLIDRPVKQTFIKEEFVDRLEGIADNQDTFLLIEFFFNKIC